MHASCIHCRSRAITGYFVIIWICYVVGICIDAVLLDLLANADLCFCFFILFYFFFFHNRAVNKIHVQIGFSEHFQTFRDGKDP